MNRLFGFFSWLMSRSILINFFSKLTHIVFALRYLMEEWRLDHKMNK